MPSVSSSHLPLPNSLSLSLPPLPFLQNALMQQPLAHLYFLTVLEHLMTQQWLLSGFVRLANSISEMCSSPEVCDRDKVLLWIELQAVVQVIAQNVPHHLDPSKQDNIVQFNPLREDINRYNVGCSYIYVYALMLSIYMHNCKEFGTCVLYYVSHENSVLNFNNTCM